MKKLSKNILLLYSYLGKFVILHCNLIQDLRKPYNKLLLYFLCIYCLKRNAYEIKQITLETYWCMVSLNSFNFVF